MAHDHHHHGHDHAGHFESMNKAFIIGIVLNFAFVVVEVFVGLDIHSLSLLSDAGHNLADVASLGLGLFAMKMLKVKPTENYTYGYKKTTILVALLNAAILLLSIGAIGYEAIIRLMDPIPLPGKTISIVAAIGIVINTITALMFFRGKEKDINVKGAYLHLMSDAVVSLGLVIGGVVMLYTGYYWIDPVLSIVIAIVILFSTWSLLRQSLRLSLDGVPKGISIEAVKTAIKKRPGVSDFRHVHIWAISTTENALTGHLVLPGDILPDAISRIKNDVKHELEHLNIQHSTLEIEFEHELSTKVEC